MAHADATTEESSKPTDAAGHVSTAGTFLPTKWLVQTDGSELATETRWLLQLRLRAASLVLVVGFSLFLARSFILYKFESLAVFFYGMMVVLPIACMAILSSRHRPTLRQLRALETTLFALIVVFFMAAQYVVFLHRVRDNDPVRLAGSVKSSTLWMVAFMFIYAIFIPNTWHRAAKLIVPMALAPLTVPWILGAVHPEFYQVAIRAASFERISEDGLFLVLGALTAIFGTHTINTLRIEAYRRGS